MPKVDPARLNTALLNTGLQSKDNPLYQVINNLIGLVAQLSAELEALKASLP